MEITVKRSEKLADRAAAYYVRIEAMTKGFGTNVDGEIGEHDREDTHYIVAYDEVLPVSTCRLFWENDTEAKIERVCTIELYRNKGIGSLVIEEAERELAESGVKHIVITSRAESVRFYEKLGYAADRSVVVRPHQEGRFDLVYMEKYL